MKYGSFHFFHFIPDLSTSTSANVRMANPELVILGPATIARVHWCCLLMFCSKSTLNMQYNGDILQFKVRPGLPLHQWTYVMPIFCIFEVFVEKLQHYVCFFLHCSTNGLIISTKLWILQWSLERDLADLNGSLSWKLSNILTCKYNWVFLHSRKVGLSKLHLTKVKTLQIIIQKNS